MGDAVVAGEHDDDAVCFAEVLGAEDECVVGVGFGGAHCGFIRSRCRLRGEGVVIVGEEFFEVFVVVISVDGEGVTSLCSSKRAFS